MSEPAPASPVPAFAAAHAAEARLGRGRYVAHVFADGTGGSFLDGTALTRFERDPVQAGYGLAIYVLADDGPPTSVTFEPVRHTATREHASLEGDTYVIERGDERVATRLEIAVDPVLALEERRLTITNRASTPRRFELTTCLEVVLQDAAHDRAHPAFSKLFVQTEWVTEAFALVAGRRPREQGARHPWLAHKFVAFDGPFERSIEWETDRARFLGRGRSRAHPRALDPGVSLSGTVGNVLDPILALRRAVRLAPGQSATALIFIGAGDTREDALAAIGMRNVTAAGVAGSSALPSERTARTGVMGDDARRGPAPSPGDGAGLRFWNGIGGFSPDGKEYVLRLRRRSDGTLALPPVPWVNCVANESFGALVSETGAGTTWSQNSREYRLTPWSNDPVLDPHDEALYLRDEETGDLWSPLPGPCAPEADFEVRHGFGVTRFRHESRELAHETAIFVARDATVKLAVLALENRSARTRRLSTFGYARLVLGDDPARTAATIATSPGSAPGTITARRTAADGAPGRVAFAGVFAEGAADGRFVCGDRASFLGVPGDVARPKAVATRESLDGRTGPGLDPCFATQAVFDVPSGARVRVAFVLGDAPDDAEAASLLARYAEPRAWDDALADVTAFWADLTGRVQIATPMPEIDLLVNGWLTYQTLACRLWGRTAFYQSGGAFGYRDQLQDAGAFLFHDPARLRAQIVLHAAHQFEEGDVLHWWHPPLARGIRTRFADDRVWLPFYAAQYVAATGDRSVLDEPATFLDGPALAPSQDEVFFEAKRSAKSASVYEHAARALDCSLGTGPHGLPLFGTGDWNDGMNRVGREGRGESVWMAFFLAAAIDAFSPLARARGDSERADRWQAFRARVSDAVERTAWDGAWYLRGYYDDGAPLGSASSDECRIDALVQAWAVISRLAPEERASAALEQAFRRLVSERDGIVRLLDPPFDRTPHDPGYIQGYVPGVRENGGQYTHAALWVVKALAEAGRADDAARVLAMLSPITHATDAPAVARYKVEPYVVAADVYGVDPHVGRGGWTWYTGSSGWMQRVAVESLLGLTLEDGSRLRIAPRVPASWPGFRLTWTRPGSRTRIVIDAKPAAAGEEAPAETVLELPEDGREHGFEVRYSQVPGAVGPGAGTLPATAAAPAAGALSASGQKSS